MIKKYDILWKGIIEEVFDDLLRFIFPAADQVFDMARGFEFLDKELAELHPEPDKRSSTRHVDKLVKAYRRDGSEEWVLCHIEVQGETRKKSLFAERMFRYYYRIFDRYQKPMTAIAIFTARDGGKMPDRYEYHFLGTSHVYRYNTYRITDPTDEELEKSNNPFAVVVLAARKALLVDKISDKELLPQKTLVARLLLGKKQFSKKKIKSILAFLNNYIVFKSPETNRIFIKEVDKITGKKNTMGIFEALAQDARKEGLKEGIREGIREGIKEGIKEGKKEGIEEGLKQGRMKEKESFVRKMLSGTELSIEKIASLADVSIYFVKKVKQGRKRPVHSTSR